MVGSASFRSFPGVLLALMLCALATAAQENAASSTPRAEAAATPKETKLKNMPFSTATPNVRQEEPFPDDKTKPIREKSPSAQKQVSTAERRISGTVATVTDGNTVTVADSKKRTYEIVMSGIDAPELTQDFGRQAREFLTDQILNKDVVIVGRELAKDRFAGKVLLNGRDINLEMVIAGFAWHYNDKETDQTDRDRQVYESAELQARKLSFNLWSNPKAIAPWEFRNGKTENPAVVLNETSLRADPVASKENPSTAPSTALSAAFVGNRRSKIYHWPGCPGYDKITEGNRVPFKTRAEAEAAGYRAAKNCKQQ